MMDTLVITLEHESRYDRLKLIDWWDQSKLITSRILVVGAGALGNEVIKNLALLGIGNITIVDFDTVSVSNLTRSVLFREADVGLPKAEVASRRALEINPEINVQTIHGDLEFDVGIGDICEHDVIIGCLDSVNARWAINQLAYRGGISWINGGIGVGEGEVSFFDPKADTACYSCSISDSMWKRRNQRFSCQGMRRNIPEGSVPTTSTMASIVGAVQVHQALLILHNKDGLLQSGEKIFLSLNPWTAFKVEIQRQEECSTHDMSVKPLLSIRYDLDASVASILNELESSGFSQPKIYLRNDLITLIECPECGYKEKPNIPLRKYPESQLTCPNCGFSERSFMSISTLSLEDEVTDSLLVKHLCLPKNEILHFDHKNGRSAVRLH
jgi:molybdopterin/thiamine biosynthesis adenylyltransferase